MLFSINNKDYTGNIVADTYKINSQPKYETYEDAKGRTHNVKIRDKVSGTFDVFFRKMSDYEAFVADLEASKSLINNTHSTTLKPNTDNVGGVYDCFIKYEPTRKIDGTYKDYMGVFTVTVEER